LRLRKAEQVLLTELEAPESQSQTSVKCESQERKVLATPADSWEADLPVLALSLAVVVVLVLFPFVLLEVEAMFACPFPP